MYVNLNKTPKSMERGMDLASKPLTPRSERPRSTYGSLEMSLQTSPGLCQTDSKCLRKDKHSGDHWPTTRP